MIETLINGKYKLILPEHRAARPEWRTGWEAERIESMLSNLALGDLVIDVGAEEGDISALLARKTGKIILFEPNPKVWPNIMAIWEANKLNYPVAYFVGFAAANDNVFTTEDAKYGHTSEFWPECAFGELIGNHGFKELAYEADSIPSITIDTLMMGVPEYPRLITIDVEGSEFEVLKGAEQTIKRHKPLLYVSVHPEFMFRMFDQYTADLVNWVVDRGYSYELLAFDHEFHFFFKPI